MLQGKETKKYPYSSSSSFFAARFSVPPAYTPGNKFNEITISCTCEAQCPIRTVQEREVGNGPQGIRITEPRVKVYKLCCLLAVHTGAGIPTWYFFYHLCEKYGCFRASSTLGRSSGFHCNNSRTSRSAHMFGNPIFRGSLFLI